MAATHHDLEPAIKNASNVQKRYFFVSFAGEFRVLARHLAQELAKQMNPAGEVGNEVFLDVEAVPAGQHFDWIYEEVSQYLCAVVLLESKYFLRKEAPLKELNRLLAAETPLLFVLLESKETILQYCSSVSQKKDGPHELFFPNLREHVYRLLVNEKCCGYPLATGTSFSLHRHIDGTDMRKTLDEDAQTCHKHVAIAAKQLLCEWLNGVALPTIESQSLQICGSDADFLVSFFASCSSQLQAIIVIRKKLLRFEFLSTVPTIAKAIRASPTYSMKSLHSESGLELVGSEIIALLGDEDGSAVMEFLRDEISERAMLALFRLKEDTEQWSLFVPLYFKYQQARIQYLNCKHTNALIQFGDTVLDCCEESSNFSLELPPPLPSSSTSFPAPLDSAQFADLDVETRVVILVSSIHAYAEYLLLFLNRIMPTTNWRQQTITIVTPDTMETFLPQASIIVFVILAMPQDSPSSLSSLVQLAKPERYPSAVTLAFGVFFGEEIVQQLAQSEDELILWLCDRKGLVTSFDSQFLPETTRLVANAITQCLVRRFVAASFTDRFWPDKSSGFSQRWQSFVEALLPIHTSGYTIPESRYVSAEIERALVHLRSLINHTLETVVSMFKRLGELREDWSRRIPIFLSGSDHETVRAHNNELLRIAREYSTTDLISSEINLLREKLQHLIQILGDLQCIQ